MHNTGIRNARAQMKNHGKIEQEELTASQGEMPQEEPILIVK